MTRVQRNYRKKLKRRLEDLERKAASTSSSPEPAYVELAKPASGAKNGSVSSSDAMVRQSSQGSRASSATLYDQQLSPDMYPLEDPFADITIEEHHYDFLSPPDYEASRDPVGSDYFTNDFSFPEAQQIPQIYTEPYVQHDLSQSLTPTLPSMSQYEMSKQDPYSIDDEFLNPFGISYATLVGMGQPSQQARSSLTARVNTSHLSSRRYPHSR